MRVGEEIVIAALNFRVAARAMLRIVTPVLALAATLFGVAIAFRVGGMCLAWTAVQVAITLAVHGVLDEGVAGAAFLARVALAVSIF